jgi:hypothetical protein
VCKEGATVLRGYGIGLAKLELRLRPTSLCRERLPYQWVALACNEVRLVAACLQLPPMPLHHGRFGDPKWPLQSQTLATHKERLVGLEWPLSSIPSPYAPSDMARSRCVDAPSSACHRGTASCILFPKVSYLFRTGWVLLDIRVCGNAKLALPVALRPSVLPTYLVPTLLYLPSSLLPGVTDLVDPAAVART